MKNQVQLITYVDRFGGGGLKELDALLQGPLAGVFGGVHLLPFFHPIDGADAGFDPIDHTQVDPRLGDWSDIKTLSKTLDVMGDVIVNHMSSQSPQFLDYSKRGNASPYAGLFLTMGSVFPNGATEKDLLDRLSPAAGHAVHLHDAGQRREEVSLDHVHAAAARHRRASRAGQGLPRRHLDHLRRQRRQHGAAGRCGLRDQEAGHELLHAARDV